MTPNTYWDLFAGYTVFWICIAMYLFRLVRQQSELKKRIDSIQGELKQDHETLVVNQ